MLIVIIMIDAFFFSQVFWSTLQVFQHFKQKTQPNIV